MTGQSGNRSLWGELQRRNVVRTALAYAIAGWLLIQIAGSVFPALGLPAWTVTLVVVLVALGALPVLVFAWAFEVTPEGFRRDDDALVDNASRQRAARRLDLLTVAAVVALIGLQWVLRAPAPAPATPTATAAAPAAPAAVEPTAADTRVSLAVLPFENLSADPDNRYFADGISEEILNVIAGVPGFRIASRTSAFTFRDKALPIAEIARALNVAHVLEGSVRRDGARVRITAQLIRASDDSHLWSQTYERTLDDLFRVQEEIARGIVSAVEGTLGARAKVEVRAATTSTEAYEAFLRGRQMYLDRQQVPQALELLRHAVALDPKFTRAWSTLGGTLAVASNYSDLDAEALNQEAGRAARAALALDPADAEAIAVLGLLAASRDRWPDSLRHFDDAVRLDPADSTIRLWRGLTMFRLGWVDRAAQEFEAAHRLDPYWAIATGWVACARVHQDRQAEAAALAADARDRGWQFAALCLAAGIDATTAADRLDRIWSDLRASRLVDRRIVGIESRPHPGLPPAEQERLLRWFDPGPDGRDTRAAAASALGVALLLDRPEAMIAAMRREIALGDSTTLTLLWGSRLASARRLPEYAALVRELGIEAFFGDHPSPDQCRLEGGSWRCNGDP